MHPRNKAIDMARGFSLLTLPAIHSALFYSNPEFSRTGLGITLAFIAEFLGAPVFMLTMGWSVTLGRKKTIKTILLRSLQLFVLGYFLNFLKFGIPYLTGSLPDNLFLENQITKNIEGLLSLLAIGDILQLAAFSYLLCGFLFRLKYYGFYVAVLMILFVIISPLIWNIRSNNAILDYLLQLLNGSPPICFFPVFPWIIYPLAGLVMGFLDHRLAEQKLLRLTTLFGFLIVIFCILLASLEPPDWNSNFYRLGISGTALHIASAILFINFCFMLSVKIKANSFVTLLEKLSRNVTAVYMIQWVLVCWCLPVFGYHELDIKQTCIAMTLITCMTIFLSNIYDKTKTLWKRSMI